MGYETKMLNVSSGNKNVECQFRKQSEMSYIAKMHRKKKMRRSDRRQASFQLAFVCWTQCDSACQSENGTKVGGFLQQTLIVRPTVFRFVSHTTNRPKGCGNRLQSYAYEYTLGTV